VEIVKRSDIAKGFAVLPKRWIVERTIAWLNRCRRLAKDWECLRGRFEIAWSAVQLIEQCLGLLQVTRVEAFGEPTIDRSEQFPSLLRLALFAPETR
jgi:hypothetical protein